MKFLSYVSFSFRSRLFKPLQKVGTLLSPILIKPLNKKLVGEGLTRLQWPNLHVIAIMQTFITNKKP
jgi:hypothetical protein